MGASVNCRGHLKVIEVFMSEMFKEIPISGELKSV